MFCCKGLTKTQIQHKLIIFQQLIDRLEGRRRENEDTALALVTGHSFIFSLGNLPVEKFLYSLNSGKPANFWGLPSDRSRKVGVKT